MKTRLIIYPTMIAMLSLYSCEKNTDKSTENSIEAQNEISGPLHENDTNMVKRDGTLLDGTLDQAEEIQLPDKVIESIGNEIDYTVENIVKKTEFKENGVVYYEITFKTDSAQSKTVVFDENGKITSEN